MKIIVTIDRPGDVVTDFEIGDMLEYIRHSIELGGNTDGYLDHHDNAKWTLELEDGETK